MPWSVEHEIVRLAETDGGFAEACDQLRLAEASSIEGWDQLLEWAQRGSETFSYAFKLRLYGGDSKSFLLKAFVPHPLTMTPSEAVERYVRNTASLMAVGVLVPKLYAANRGLVLTDYIEWDLAECHRRHRCQRESCPLDEQALAASRKIELAGYRPVVGSLDFRTDGSSVYLVDLGSDLGTPCRMS